MAIAVVILFLRGNKQTAYARSVPIMCSNIIANLFYYCSKILTTKLDVYSFGVVLLEIGTALRAYVDSREPHSLVDYVVHVQARIGKDPKKMIEALADRRYPPIDRWFFFSRNSSVFGRRKWPDISSKYKFFDDALLNKRVH